MNDFIFYTIIFISAIGAGFINAIAGGGTLITYPVLVALGIPPVSANITNTIALCPGYIGGTIAQRHDLKGQGRQLLFLIPFAIAGGVTGALFLVFTDDKLFIKIIPFLIILASLLLLVQDNLKNALKRAMKRSSGTFSNTFFNGIAIFFASVYGGYFGAGLGVILLAVLGFFVHSSMIRINALKQALSFSINISAAIFFSFSDKVIWPVVLVMAVAAYSGGFIGSRVATNVNPVIFKFTVVSIGFIIAIIFFIKQY